MAFHVFDDKEQGALFTVIVVTIPICVTITILRFVGTRRSDRKIGWEDWFALLALVFYLVYSCMMLWTVVTTNGVSVFNLAKLPPDVILRVMKVGYAMNPQFSVSQTFAKFSLLVLYRRVFSFSPRAVACAYVIAVVQLMWFIAMFFIRWFMCTPVSKVWISSTPGTCINSQILLAAGESVNSIIDFAMVGLAIVMVRTWMMSTSMRWKLSLLFALGGFSGVIGFIKIGQAYGQIGSNYINAIWNIVQMATSIMCCCAPIYKTILPDVQVWKSIKSTFSSTGTRSSKSTGSSRGANSQHNKQGAPDWSHPDGSSTSELAEEDSKKLSPQPTHLKEDAGRKPASPLQPMPQGFDMV